MLAQPELEARRWDGYRGLVAPQLLGSWAWPGALLQAGPETRMQGAMDGLLNRLPFWYSVRHPLHGMRFSARSQTHGRMCTCMGAVSLHKAPICPPVPCAVCIVAMADAAQTMPKGEIPSMGLVEDIQAAMLPRGCVIIRPLHAGRSSAAGIPQHVPGHGSSSETHGDGQGPDAAGRAAGQGWAHAQELGRALAAQLAAGGLLLRGLEARSAADLHSAGQLIATWVWWRAGVWMQCLQAAMHAYALCTAFLWET